MSPAVHRPVVLETAVGYRQLPQIGNPRSKTRVAPARVANGEMAHLHRAANREQLHVGACRLNNRIKPVYDDVFIDDECLRQLVDPAAQPDNAAIVCRIYRINKFCCIRLRDDSDNALYA